MRVTCVQGTVRSNGHGEPVRFLVDCRATYPLLPHPVSSSLSLTPKREMEFVLAGGAIIRRAISECCIVLPQGKVTPPSFLGSLATKPCSAW